MKYEEMPRNLEDALEDFDFEKGGMELVNELCSMYSALYGDLLDALDANLNVIETRKKKLKNLVMSEFEDTPRNRAIKLTQILKIENLEEY